MYIDGRSEAVEVTQIVATSNQEMEFLDYLAITAIVSTLGTFLTGM